VSVTSARGTRGATDSRARVPVLLDVPQALRAKAVWVLETLCAAAGCGLEIVPAPEPARGAALAYAPRPVAGVPTIPVSHEALRTVELGADLPAGSFRSFDEPVPLVGAFPVEDQGFAVPFDLVASAFLLLAAWDEHVRPGRDRHGRFPYDLSFFATESALDPSQPALDGYVAVLRRLLSESVDLVPGRWRHPKAETPDASFAVALTHDVDDVWRWTPRGLAAALRRAVLDLGARDYARSRWELEGVLEGLGRHLPRGTDPYWTFPDLLRREDALGVDSTFFVIASHHERLDGVEPAVYRRRSRALLRLLRAAARETGLHGNSRDRLDPATLAEDRSRLQEMTIGSVRGMRFHYLRCLYHETLPLLAAAGFAYDSSLAFAEHEGPRCALSFPFRPYFLAEDRPLDLIELPLVVMDGTLQERHYRGLPVEQGLAAARRVLGAVRDAGGAAALLWHNTRLDPLIARGYGRVYWELVEWIRAEGGAATSAGDVVGQWRSRVER
jgi:peptidoglycan/xylan/chitin deacetylase (PgdA/CDA1 family)